MDSRFLRNVLLKGLALFFILNLAFVAVPPGLGKLSLYNRMLDGRERFPFGENPAQSYNLSLFDLDAMFASHLIAAGPKPADEYRVLLIGDSSVWGTLQHPEETLAGQLNAAGKATCEGKTVRVYNLGYPTISLAKDLMVLDYAMRYDPDLILWGVTLEAFPADKQWTTPLVANNAARVDDLTARYDLSFDANDPALIRPSIWDRTLIGQRRALADLIRLQMYGVLWSATGIDQAYPADYTPAQKDFDADENFHDFKPPVLDESRLAFDVLQAGLTAAGDVPVVIFNEPMLISAGENSDLRYNFFYPRWAYDQWRQTMNEKALENGWNYLDLWDLIPDISYYTNSAIHLTPAGEAILAKRLEQEIEMLSCP
jgi:hypothetical protein